MADAALGAVFGEILRAVVHAVKGAAKFKSILRRLEATLSEIEPIVNEMEKLNNSLGRPTADTKPLADLLREGKVLVDKCLTIQKWKLSEMYTHSNKLQRYDDSLIKFFQISVQGISAVDVRKILVELEKLRVSNGGGSSSGFRGSCGVPQLPEGIVGLDMQLEELKGMMMLNDEVILVGISAPGGCGKTTLAKMLCHDEEIKDIFVDNIIYTTVSKPSNFQVIVQNLFRHKGCPQPLFQSDEDAVNQLEQFLLQQGPDPILLVLDDVWPGFESHILNIRFRNIPGYKILVTSRSMFPIFDSTYNLKLLNDEDATTLFCHSAIRKGIPNVPNDLVDKMVRSCKGFPLALTVVGRSLHQMPAVMWRSVLANWSEGESILDSNKQLLCHLQTSIDALDKPILKELFLDLGSFPEDQEIPATALMDICADLYNLDEQGMHTMTNLLKLSFRNLVNLVSRRKDNIEVDCDCNEHYVMQHDILRKLAIYLSNQEPVEQRKRLIMNLTKSKFDQSQLPLRARLLSISTNEMFSSSWCDMDLPEVEVVILNLQSKNYTLPPFMERMERLKVLIVTNYGYSPSNIDNLPLLGHIFKLRRIRLERVSLSSLSTSLLPMRNLQKISFIMCEIGGTFDKCTTEIGGMFPNLVELEIEYCEDLVHFPVGLCDNITLKKLNVANCNELLSLPKELGKLTDLEVLRLHSCTRLEELPESIGSLHKLRIIDISDCVSLSKMPDETRELCSLRMLHMRGCSGIRELPPLVEDLRGLEHVICDEEIYPIWKSYEEFAGVNIEEGKPRVNLNSLHNLGL